MTAKEEASVFVVVRSGTPNTLVNLSINNWSSSGKTKTSRQTLRQIHEGYFRFGY